MQIDRLKERGLHEAKRFVAMFIYLFILFGLLEVHKSVVLAQNEIDYTAHGVALINALVFAKVMLVAEDLKIGPRFENKPLAIPVLYKSIVFAVVFIGFHIVEHVLIGLFRGKTLWESVPGIGGGGLTGILSVGLIATFALIPYFAFGEVGRVIGEAKLRSLLFTRGARGLQPEA